MDNEYVLEAVKHVELNPVRSGLVTNPEDYPWSSARAHDTGVNDGLTHGAAIQAMVGDWAAFLRERTNQEAIEAIRRHERTGRPLGNDTFLDNLENKLRRVLRPGRPGRKPMAKNNAVAPLRTTNA
jgi:putative transposase